MKFQFAEQPFQAEAAGSIVKVFAGQPLGTGIRNAPVALSRSDLLTNIRAVQTENNIICSPTLSPGLGAVSLDIEMETGTGKTYVYIKTMFELYNIYGWNKFIVVVPSVAIREGVKKSFEVTQEHFMDIYGQKIRFFVYNSAEPDLLDEFYQNTGPSAMIINMQSFNTKKNERLIYTKRDGFESLRPIDVIKETHPIIILDEPQRMGGAATQNALKENFNPLFSLNFSATHRTSHDLVYVLDALDAFQKRLVKKIEVKGFEPKNLAGADGYLYLSAIVLDRKEPPKARMEYEANYKGGIKRETRLFSVNDSLFKVSRGLEEYRNVSVADIDPLKNLVAFSNGLELSPGEASGNITEDDLRRIQIRETIASHLDKEEVLFDQGVKCLSLFFIDEVARYPEYGRIFEEEYSAAVGERIGRLQPGYRDYLNGIETDSAYRGYFSTDKKGQAVNSAVKRGNEFSDDISAYELILQNKERILSFEEPTRFIFSHSALREGWDNPNVFQICTLKHSDSSVVKRQEVGRGLRLCVNNLGERQDFEICDLNILTVVASESYAEFVAGLQSEIEADLYERPSKVSEDYFKKHFSEADSRKIYHYLILNGYVDENGDVTDKYRADAASGSFEPIKGEISALAAEIHRLVQSIFDPSILKSMAKNAHDTKVSDNKLNENWPLFEEMWTLISKRWAFTVMFDEEELIKKSIAAIDERLIIARLSYKLTTGRQMGPDFGLGFKVSHHSVEKLDRAQGINIEYDLIGKLAAEALLTRQTIASILKGIKNLELFRDNPEEFIKRVSALIKEQKAKLIAEGIAYAPSAEEPFSEEVFNVKRAPEAYKSAYVARKAVQDYVFTDSVGEREFAMALDTAEEVRVYARLPRGFYIPTPVGRYSPDWAIVFKDGTFLVAETKGTLQELQSRPVEWAKVMCAKKVFTGSVRYHAVDSYDRMLEIIG